MSSYVKQKEDLQDSRKEAQLSKKKLETEKKKIRRESDVSKNRQFEIGASYLCW